MLSTIAGPTRSRAAEDRTGDRKSRFEDLIAIHSPYLYRYACWLCRDRTLADDLVQETFLRAWRFLGTLQDDKAARFWLRTILRREHARLYERKQLDIDADFSLDTLAGDDVNLEFLDLQAGLASLPAMYREPLLLQALGGYSCNEIASLLGLRRGAVMTRVFRARQKLREILGETRLQKAA